LSSLQICALLLIGILFSAVFFVIRCRRSPVPANLHGNGILEAAWVAVAPLLAFAIFWFGLARIEIFYYEQRQGSISTGESIS